MAFTSPILLIQSPDKPHERLIQILNGGRYETVASVPKLDDMGYYGHRREFPKLIIVCLSEGAVSLEAVAAARRRFPMSRIVIVAERYDHHEMIEAFRIGAVAYLLKEISAAALSSALTLAATEDVVLLAGRDSEAESRQTVTRQTFGASGSTSAAREAINPASALSPRETTILELVKGGDSNKHIARKLGIAEATVKCHVKAILRKINVRNRFDAAMWALRADGLQQRPAEPVQAERECSQHFVPGRMAQRARAPDAA